MNWTDLWSNSCLTQVQLFAILRTKQSQFFKLLFLIVCSVTPLSWPIMPPAAAGVKLQQRDWLRDCRNKRKKSKGEEKVEVVILTQGQSDASKSSEASNWNLSNLKGSFFTRAVWWWNKTRKKKKSKFKIRRNRFLMIHFYRILSKTTTKCKLTVYLFQ